jgi:hypothetical protein
MRTKLNYQLKSLILRLANKNPHLGVRRLSQLLGEKHNIGISKSAISSIIKKSKGREIKLGRKKETLPYKRAEISDCGLFLLRAIDSLVNLIEILTQELKLYFPHLNERWLKKIILLVTFSGYTGVSLEKNAKRSGLLRLVDIYFYPARKIKYFLNRLNTYKPVVSLAAAKKNLSPVSTIRFSFENKATSYLDAKMTTFWDSPCNLSAFFAPLYWAKERLLLMLKDRVIYINYTKSFDYLSSSVVNFIAALAAGIKKIDFLSPENKVLETYAADSLKASYLIGYYPKTFLKSMMFLEKEKEFKKLKVLEDVLYAPLLTRFAQPKTTQGIILNNLLIKFKEHFSPSWGILAQKTGNLEPALRKYLMFFPYPEKTFLDQMKLIEKSFFSQEEKKDLSQDIPATIFLEREEDFIKIADILYSLFKKEVAETLELKGKRGYLTRNSNCYQLILRDIPLEPKRKFNSLCLYLGDKRVFIA